MTVLRCTGLRCSTTLAEVSAGHLVIRARHHGEHHAMAWPLAAFVEAAVDEASLPVVAAALLARIAQAPVSVLESAR